MEYQKIINLLDNTPNQLCKFKTKNWVEINDESWGACNEGNQIRLKTSMLRSGLCDYSNSYILVKGNITVENKAAQDQPNNAIDKKVIFRNCAPFTNCISRINNTQVEDVNDFDIVMSTYKLIKYSAKYSKMSGILWQYYRDEPALAANAVIDFIVANAITDSFRIKEKITGQTGNNGTEDVEIMVPLKHLSNLWRTLEIRLINNKINLDLNWSKKSVIVATDAADQDASFSLTNAKLYVLVVTLSTQNNAKLLEQFKSGWFNRKTRPIFRLLNWSKFSRSK